jgi:asparagine synthetase B (glutamine-hydrolysing)
LYDERCGKVMAARDRFGVKPLFWTVVEGEDEARVLIAPEAKAFLALDWKAEWDVDAIVDGGWEYDDRSLFRGVRKVLPGHFMELTVGGRVVHQQYWDIEHRDKVNVLLPIKNWELRLMQSSERWRHARLMKWSLVSGNHWPRQSGCGYGLTSLLGSTYPEGSTPP